METIEYTTFDKGGWGEGPWQTEVDKRQWRDAATGLPCLIVRNRMGSLCGYVGVSKEHPAHGLHYSSPEHDSDGLPFPVTSAQQALEAICVHGGLTFSKGCGHGDESVDICHIPDPGEPDNVHWFGFDCGHYMDLSPGLGYQEHRSPFPASVYRDIDYVARDCARLAQQLAAMVAVTA